MDGSNRPPSGPRPAPESKELDPTQLLAFFVEAVGLYASYLESSGRIEATYGYRLDRLDQTIGAGFFGELAPDGDRGTIARLLQFLERFDRISGAYPGDRDLLNPAQKIELARQLRELAAEGRR
ncbi:MAG: hypothetical protein L3K18_04445 [Thermoplasmata archaeon]|nr:hypothetical protein [Thermoplasmata archaeon]